MKIKNEIIKNCVNCNIQFKTNLKNKIKCKINCKKYIIYKIEIIDKILDNDNMVYIGSSIDFLKRKQDHLRNIKKCFENKKLWGDNSFYDLLVLKDYKDIPLRKTLYFKIISYFILNDIKLSLNNIKIEIIDYLNNFNNIKNNIINNLNNTIKEIKKEYKNNELKQLEIINRKCLYCNIYFKTTLKRDKKYCNSSCYIEYKKLNNNKIKIFKKCFCGNKETKTFKNNVVVCSFKCYENWYKENKRIKKINELENIKLKLNDKEYIKDIKTLYILELIELEYINKYNCLSNGFNGVNWLNWKIFYELDKEHKNYIIIYIFNVFNKKIYKELLEKVNTNNFISYWLIYSLRTKKELIKNYDNLYKNIYLKNVEIIKNKLINMYNIGDKEYEK